MIGKLIGCFVNVILKFLMQPRNLKERLEYLVDEGNSLPLSLRDAIAYFESIWHVGQHRDYFFDDGRLFIFAKPD